MNEHTTVIRGHRGLRPGTRHRADEMGRLRDFTTTTRVVFLAAMAIPIGALSAVVAYVLLRLIGLLTNICFFGRWSTELVSPAGNRLGALVILVPMAGALVIGLMARFGSERIRGHGIPEALEAILINGSRLEPRVAALKPLSSAISIGSGGPFGAEGPIIMTGGAFGSLIAQFFACRMGETGLSAFPVVERGNGQRLLGMVGPDSLLKGRARNLVAEMRRERVLTLHVPLPRHRATARSQTERGQKPAEG